MAESGDGGSRLQWRSSVSREAPAVRNLQVRTVWVNQHQAEMVKLVQVRPLWYRDQRRQEYLTSEFRTCLFAATANGARDLALPVPVDFETRAVRDPSLAPFFRAGDGNYALVEAAVAPYIGFAQDQIPGLRVGVPPNPVGLDIVIHRLNMRLPTIVFLGEGTHAIELNGVLVEGRDLKFGVVDPLIGRFQTLSLQDLVNKGLGLNASEGTLRTVGLSRVTR